MKRLYITVVVLCICATSIFAQINFIEPDARFKVKHRIGVVAGMNYGKVAKAEMGYKSRGIAGFQAGANYELEFHPNFFIDATIQYAMKSFEMKSKSDASYMLRRMHNIDIPVHIGYKLHLNNNLAVFATVGPYLGFGISGYWEQVQKHPTKDGYYKQTIDLYKKKSGDERVEFGVGYKIGVEFLQHYQVMIGYDWGLSYLNKEYDDLRNRSLQVSITYLF